MKTPDEALAAILSLQAAFKQALSTADWPQVQQLDQGLRSMMDEAMVVVTSGQHAEEPVQIALRDAVKELIETYTSQLIPELDNCQTETQSQLKSLNDGKKGARAYSQTYVAV